MDFVNAEDMFGGDDDTSSDEAAEPAPPAVSDVAPVTVRSGDEKDPPSKEPAAVAAELRAARGAQEDGGDDGGKPTGKIPLFMHPPSHTCVALALEESGAERCVVATMGRSRGVCVAGLP